MCLIIDLFLTRFGSVYSLASKRSYHASPQELKLEGDRLHFELTEGTGGAPDGRADDFLGF